MEMESESFYADGTIYEGNINDGKPNGKGRYTYTSGNDFQGDVKDGEPHGKGKMTFPMTL